MLFFKNLSTAKLINPDKTGFRMTFSAIEWMALIVALLGAGKLLMILTNPRRLIGIANKIYQQPSVTYFLSLLLAAISLWFLLQELTIVQVFACMLFFMFIVWAGFAPHSKEMSELANKLIKRKDLVKGSLLYILIWIILLLWVFKALLIA